MNEEQSAGEVVALALIDQADRMGKSARATQQGLAAQIEQLARLQQWAEASIQSLQKQAGAAIKALEAERAQWQGARAGLEHSAGQAIHEAARQQSAEIGRQVTQAMAAPLQDVGQAAAQVRQNVKEMGWLLMILILAFGIILGLLFGWWPMRSRINSLEEQGNRIEQALAAQQAQVAPAAPAPPHAPIHRAK